MSNEFPDEPLGAEAAIFYHLVQMDHWDYQATQADAMDMPDTAQIANDKAMAHNARLQQLETEFPETAKVARESLTAYYEQLEKEALE
jgi:hypothetical protein